MDRSAAPRLTVAVRTQGRRPDLLEEALLSLAAQTVEDLEVLVAVHTGDAAAVDGTRAIVNAFAGAFAARVQVFGVEGGTRSRPLNEALDRATGDLLAFLDDDDVVTAHWAEVFLTGAESAPGSVIRSVTADQPVRRLRGDRPPHFEPTGPVIVPEHRRAFDLVEHLEQNRTPICAFAVPLDAVRRRRLRFDENVPVMEDWQFLVHAILQLGVHDTGEVTAVYRRWDDHEATWHAIDRADWSRSRRAIWESFDAVPLVLPEGSAQRLRSLLSRSREPEASPAAPAPPAETPDTSTTMREVERELGRVRKERDRALARVRAIEASTSWRITGPVRRLLDRLRRRG